MTVAPPELRARAAGVVGVAIGVGVDVGGSRLAGVEGAAIAVPPQKVLEFSHSLPSAASMLWSNCRRILASRLTSLRSSSSTAENRGSSFAAAGCARRQLNRLDDSVA